MRYKYKSFRNRYIIVYVFSILLFAPILYRLLCLQVLHRTELTSLAEKQHNLVIELPPRRGQIYDRNQNQLAISLKVPSVYVVPRLLYDKEENARTLAKILDLEYSFVKERLMRDKNFVWLKRKISEEQATAIRQLDDPNIMILYETKRFYPHNELLSHVLGFCDIDNKGLEGIELTLDEYLKGRSGYHYSKRDARGRRLVGLEDRYIPPVHGYDVVLTIDQYIQHIVETELDSAFKQWKAKGAMAVVMDCRDGRILAIANRPTYDLNSYSKADESMRRNRVVTDYFEPGSVFKIVTAVAGLQEKAFTLEDEIFCENGNYQPLRGRTLHDVHPYGTIDYPTIFIKSSNIGTVKVAQKVGEEKIYRYIKEFGFGNLTGVDLPGEVMGVVRPPSTWSKYSITSIPMGQEVTVTALQMVTALSVIANGGNLVTPYIIDEIKDSDNVVIKKHTPFVKRTIIDEDVCAQVREILIRAVEEGTGKKAIIEGIKVGGKTGTAQKVAADGKGYSRSAYMASFIGFVPADQPMLSVIVVLDEPGPMYYGGVVSCPVFKNIAEKTLNYLGYSKNETENM
jgi:cell division protein FtsI (penicillin-binding protein 3)